MIIFTHHTGEPHGILGAQIAATFFKRKLSIPSIVIGIERNFSKEHLLHFVDEYDEGKNHPAAEAPSPRHPPIRWLQGRKIIAFSHLCGRIDLLELIQELKQRGYTTLLAGPQAHQDYSGEPDTDLYPHRFKGLRSIVDIAFQGPVDCFQPEYLRGGSGLLEFPWTRDIFLEVDWSVLYTFSDTLNKIEVQLGQVLNAIGCPYASRRQTITLPPPSDLRECEVPELEVHTKGCSFCDVSWDKGYHGSVQQDRLMSQIVGLPEVDGRKIPFELIDEYPVRSLGRLFEDAQRHAVRLSQINLVCRVDDINTHASDLEEIMSLARRQDVKVMFASIGFESFSDRLLRYFCKGITVADIVKCVETLRRLKDRFGRYFLYRRDEGANHGFIRPTPWDNSETLQEIDTNIFLHRLFDDILPDRSTPLIIHHASYLADWIRQIESTKRVAFSRSGTWIEWWNPSLM